VSREPRECCYAATLLARGVFRRRRVNVSGVLLGGLLRNCQRLHFGGQLGVLGGLTGLLSGLDQGGLEERAITLAHRKPVTRPLVVGGEAGGVGGEGDLAVEDLVEGVAALAGRVAVGVENGEVHEMHLG